MSMPEAPRRGSDAMTVMELAAEMVDPIWRDADRPLIQFIMNWRQRPEQRLAVLAGPPPENIDEVVAAKIAAVVHALCDRDGLEVPSWVHRCRLDVGIGLFGVPLDTPYGEGVCRRAPRTCAQHGVWFGTDMLNA